jgi:hypothetical protein
MALVVGLGENIILFYFTFGMHAVLVCIQERKVYLSRHDVSAAVAKQSLEI